MPYPDLPKNRLVVNGVDLTDTYGMVLLDGYQLNPPTPKTYIVDIPAGGQIDLTELYAGDVPYNNREMMFNFAIIYPERFEEIKTDVANFLHGQRYDFTMSMDPGYTYTGRFTIAAYETQVNGKIGVFQIKVDAEPYKRKQDKVYQMLPIAGKAYYLESGRKKVHPTVELKRTTTFFFKGNEFELPAGTWIVNSITLQDGINEVYVNSYKIFDTEWNAFIDQNYTWEDLHAQRWDYWSSYGYQTDDVLDDKVNQNWEELHAYKWSELSTKTWYNFRTNFDDIGAEVYFTYEWKDL